MEQLIKKMAQDDVWQGWIAANSASRRRRTAASAPRPKTGCISATPKTGCIS